MPTRSWNRVELIGNLTRDPEMRYTPSGAAVATFSIATNRTFVTDGEKKEEVDFHRCVAWTKLAELCQQLLKKGNRVFVSGRLQNRSWADKDGGQRNTTEIVIEDMLLLTSDRQATSGGDNYAEPAADASEFKAPAKAKTEPKVDSKEEPKDESPKPTKEEKEEVDIDDLPF